MKPIIKFNGGRGAILCNECGVIIKEDLTKEEIQGETDLLFCRKCNINKDMNKQWFEENVVVGAFPDQHFNAISYKYVINVSDEFYPNIDSNIRNAGCQTFWFPMNEAKKDIGINSIYAACVILHQAEKENARVYLHCHAGINRSRIVWSAYHFMRTQSHISRTTRSGYMNPLISACHKQYLPSKEEMEKFLINLNGQLEIKNMMAGLLDHCKIESISNNF